MKISGITIVRNAIKFGYPALEAIRSVLPICDELIVNVGDSSDGTLELIRSLKDPKIRIVERVWDMSIGQDVLSVETNYAVSQCTGDWVIYVQTDEMIHDDDLKGLKKDMQKYLNDPKVDAFQLKWLHFYGSFYRYRIDAGWFQKQIRVIKNNGTCESHDGAWGFRRKDKNPIGLLKTPYFIYHYGWVNDPQLMAVRRKNAHELGFFAELTEKEKKSEYNFESLSRFPVYFGTHPSVMKEMVEGHQLSNQDWQKIVSMHWWNPLLWFRVRYKTGRRIKEKLEG